MPEKSLSGAEKIRAREIRRQVAVRVARHRAAHPDRPRSVAVDAAITQAVGDLILDMARRQEADPAIVAVIRRVKDLALARLGGGEEAQHAVKVRLTGVARVRRTKLALPPNSNDYP